MIQPIVNGTGTGSVYATYGIKYYMVYNAIQKRTLPAESYTWDLGIDLVDENIIETRYTKETPNQTLWLLSRDETSFLASSETTSPISIISDDEWWWLRSPNYVNNTSEEVTVDAVTEFGTIGTWELSNSYGIRPAFQFTIE